jgi:type IV pilus assembly protein PilV
MQMGGYQYSNSRDDGISYVSCPALIAMLTGMGGEVMQVLSRQRGVSLIEVMMALLIFSVGLIGLAGLLVMATRSNHAAYLRTQVTFLASNMADRMRANPTAVWDASYNQTFPYTNTQVCDSSTACTPDQIAVYDMQRWNTQLATFLPNASASIGCDNTTAGFNPTAQLGMRPPYGGNCTMKINWSERSLADKNHADSAVQTFAWEFQP